MTPISDAEACKQYKISRGWIFTHQDDPNFPGVFQIAGKNHRFEEHWQAYFKHMMRVAADRRQASLVAAAKGSPIKRPRGRPRKNPVHEEQPITQ